jgi:hypothetical protein
VKFEKKESLQIHGGFSNQLKGKMVMGGTRRKCVVRFNLRGLGVKDV